MLVEIEKYVDLDDNLPTELLGSYWEEFKLQIPEEQYNILDGTLKLILALSGDTTEIVTLIHNTITNHMEPHAKKMEVYYTVLNTTLSLLEEAGIEIEDEHANIENFKYFSKLLQLLLEIGHIEDVYGLIETLDSSDTDNKDKLISCYCIIHGEEEEDKIQELVVDVSSVLIKTIKAALTDDEYYLESVSEEIVKRVRDNRWLFEGTLGREVLDSQTAIESDIKSLLNFYESELYDLNNSDNSETRIKHFTNLLSLYMVSSLTNEQIKVKVDDYQTTYIGDIQESMLLDDVLIKVNLNND